MGLLRAGCGTATVPPTALTLDNGVDPGRGATGAVEIEDHLQEHPSIDDVAVVAMPDSVLGERACAFVVPRGAQQPRLEDLRAFLPGRGLAVQKSPSGWEVVGQVVDGTG